MGILDAPSVSPSALRAAQAPGPRVAIIGDSKTANFGGGWLKIAVQRAAKPLWGGYFATSGFTLAQIQTTHLPTVLALSGWAKPSACAIDGFTNDVNAGGYSFAGSQATLLSIATALQSAGIAPMLVCQPPNASATNAADIVKWNAWLRGLGARYRWHVLDVYAAVANTAGGWQNNLSGDAKHPNGQGNRIIGAALAPQLAALFPTAQGLLLSRSIGDGSNLLASNAQLFSGTPSGGVASNWSASGAGCVFTVITSDTSIAGNWQTLNRPQAATANAFMQLSPAVTTGFSAGDRLAFACLYQTAGFEGGDVNQSAYILLNFYDSGGSVLAVMNPISSTQSACSVSALAYDEIMVPAGTASIRVGAGVNGAATTSTLQLAQPTLTNLTALGIA
jgi:lysophospholipase L1-like esterase